jgi:7SK snRNA methylphosphate capping enzyme
MHSLNVTKWIHLHSGDDGMHTLFDMFTHVTAPGGLLILEAQSWHAYSAAAKRSRVARQQRTLLRLRPKQFVPMLIATSKFELVATRRISYGKFWRPMSILRRCCNDSDDDEGDGVVEDG